jgi:antirestriction protein
LEKGIASERQGDLIDAIEMYEWSIQNYTPLIHHTHKAIERLESIAAESEIQGATDTALDAWQAIVSGLAVIRHVQQPYAEEKEHAQIELDRLRDRIIQKRKSAQS